MQELKETEIARLSSLTCGPISVCKDTSDGLLRGVRLHALGLEFGRIWPVAGAENDGHE